MSEATAQTTGQESQSQNQSEEGKAGNYTPPATQEELDQIIENRLSRERRKFADYDELKAQKSEMDKWKQSQLTEQEQAVQAAREESAKETAGRYDRKIADAEIRLQAQSKGFHDPTDALAAFTDKPPIKDGEPDTDAIGKKLDALAKAKPYLLKNQQTIPKGGPKLPSGIRISDTHDGKGKAAAALRQLGASIHPR
jgi:hypothetical protein